LYQHALSGGKKSIFYPFSATNNQISFSEFFQIQMKMNAGDTTMKMKEKIMKENSRDKMPY